MKVDFTSSGEFQTALVHVQPGQTVVSDSGAMYRSSPNIDFDVSVRSRGGGILSGLKRAMGGDSFFLSTYKTQDQHAGEVGLAPVLPGDIRHVDVDGSTWVCAGGSFLACDGSLDMDTRFQGLKGLFSGESLFFVEVAGQGGLLVNAYGRISEVEVTDELVVDTGHVVAFESSLSYELTKMGSSWVQSFLAGEGFVLRFRGSGRLLVQSHNPKEFGSRLGKHLPPRKA